ncbi:MAG: hypothetical protein U9Q07_04020 [Planctomycetota bacterium]|nr:hypothetical protein [Planctomycetota bacterium]
MKRDPQIDPKEGDVLRQVPGTREILIDRVSDKEVAYRVTDGCGGLVGAYRMNLADWCEAMRAWSL